MQLTPDWSFFLQVITFIALWAGLERLVFAPMRQVLDAREKQTTAAQAEAVHLRGVAETERGEYEKALHDLRAGLAADAAAARNTAAGQQATILGEARSTASDELGKLRQSLAAQVEAARSVLAADAENIAAEMLARATGGSRA